jgi:hypothetical protein
VECRLYPGRDDGSKTNIPRYYYNNYYCYNNCRYVITCCIDVCLLFVKGKNFIDQLTLIFDVIGSPQSDEVAHIQNSQAKKYLSSQKGKRAVWKMCDSVVLC